MPSGKRFRAMCVFGAFRHPPPASGRALRIGRGGAARAAGLPSPWWAAPRFLRFPLVKTSLEATLELRLLRSGGPAHF
eukprot:2761769-Alexandrium_andersonii.AAC.1